MPLSFASSQNSLLSTTRARNYPSFILFERFFGVNKDISIQPRTIPTLTLPLHTCTSSTTRAHLTSLNALAASSPVAWITRSDSFSTRMRFLTLACKSSSHYRRGPPILAPPPPGGLGVVTPVYPRPADCRIRISSNVTPVELVVALDCFPASCSLYPAKAEDPAPATTRRISDTSWRTRVFGRRPICRQRAQHGWE